MDIITIDFETYYDKEFSLSKITTEEYIRSPQFEIIGVAIKVNNGQTEWASGTKPQIKEWLQTFNWADSMVVAHNTTFDGAILSWHLGVNPRYWADTLCMARALHGVEVGGSLKALAERYNIGEKGTEVINALGKTRADFTTEELSRYGDYCINDVELTYKLFNIIGRKIPKQEFKIIDLTLRMFIDPVLELDMSLLQQHRDDIKVIKEKLLAECGADKGDLMSNGKFADLLLNLGVNPPMKVSLATGKDTWAFSKTDEEFTQLASHPDVRVQTLVNARLGTKSTLEETRTERFIGIAGRGKLPVPIKYYAAHTGRFGGEDKINLQNLPSRGTNANKLKKSITAPFGYSLIDADSAQIEARVLAWLAGQDDLVEAFAKGEDVYKKMASAIYNKPEEEIDKTERFVGKTTILGCIAEGTPVLSNNGWKPIERITLTDKLWDGKEWVCHQGLVKKGIKKTLNVYGTWLTADHKILCGTKWKEAQSVVQDESMLSLALGTGVENLPLRAMLKGFGVGWHHLLYSATAGHQSIRLIAIILKTLKVPDAIYVLKNLVLAPVNYIGGIVKSSQMMHNVKDSLTASQAVFLGAIQKLAKHIPTMEGEEFLYMKSGEKIELSSYATLYHSKIGVTPSATSTASTTTKGMNPEIYGLSLGQKTLGINEKSKSYNRNLMTYDIALAGPRNRFTIATNAGPIIVHNCGYGMGAVKFQSQLKNFGVEVSIEESRRIIDIYRSTNDKIGRLWAQAQQFLVNISRGDSAVIGLTGVLEVIPEEKAIKLPSGLLMRYEGLSFVQGDKGLEFSYKSRYGRNRIYGGKVIENVCQAIARCIIAEQMLLIAKKYRVVLTVHDAVMCVVKDEEVEEATKYIEECMRWTPDWATGLPVNCESGSGKSYGDC